MIVDGTYTFDGPIERVWELLLDPEVMAYAMPGATHLTQSRDGHYEGRLRVKVGFIHADFDLTVDLRDVRRPSHYLMDIRSTGRLGSTQGEATVDLSRDAGRTTMRYRADLDVGGKLGGVGGRVLGSVSRMMTRQGLEALSEELRRRLDAERRG